MKLKMVALAIPFMFSVSSAFAATGESSTVNFTGNIVDTSCSLSTGSKDQTVPLGDVAVNAFTGNGSTAAEKAFQISLEGCDVSANPGQVSVSFSGAAVDGKSDTLQTSAMATTNVGIQILQSGSPLAVDGSASSVAQDMVDGTNDMAFSARYIALDDAVAAGEANSTASFVINYE